MCGCETLSALSDRRKEENMDYNNNVIIQNGIEIEIDDKQYLNYLRENNKPITWEILERLEEI